MVTFSRNLSVLRASSKVVRNPKIKINTLISDFTRFRPSLHFRHGVSCIARPISVELEQPVFKHIFSTM